MTLRSLRIQLQSSARKHMPLAYVKQGRGATASGRDQRGMFSRLMCRMLMKILIKTRILKVGRAQTQGRSCMPLMNGKAKGLALGTLLCTTTFYAHCPCETCPATLQHCTPTDGHAQRLTCMAEAETSRSHDQGRAHVTCISLYLIASHRSREVRIGIITFLRADTVVGSSRH